MAKEAYYFSHDANARQDEKILMMLSEHGWEGYGIYWALVEMMFESSETVLNHNKIKGISFSYNIDITLLQSVINTCITEELFVSNGEQFWSESLKIRKSKYHEIKTKKSEAGKKGMAKRWGEQQKDNTVITKDNTVITEDNKGKERKGKEIKEKDHTDINILFEDVWKEYPNKRGSKPSALKSFKKALKEGTTIEEIKKGIEQYTEYCNSSDWYSPANGSTWFNQQRWNDDYSVKDKSSNKPIEQTPKYKPFQLDLEE